MTRQEFDRESGEHFRVAYRDNGDGTFSPIVSGGSNGLAVVPGTGTITTCTATNQAISTSSFTVKAANSARKELIVSNPTTYRVWLTRGATAEVGKGILLPAGGTVVFDAAYTDVVSGIGESGASGNLGVEEAV